MKKQKCIQGYFLIGVNREVRHVRAPKSLGGVGFFISNSFLNVFSVHIVDAEVDGLLGILLTNKISGSDKILTLSEKLGPPPIFGDC